MTRESALTHAQREMMALYSSQLNRCSYCVDSHACVLTSLGTAEEVVKSLSGISRTPVDDMMQAMLTFVKKLTLEPGNITTQDIEAVRTQGWVDQAIEDAICVVSTFALVNRLVNGIGLIASDEHFQQVGGMVAQQGYGPLVQMIQQEVNAV